MSKNQQPTKYTSDSESDSDSDSDSQCSEPNLEHKPDNLNKSELVVSDNSEVEPNRPEYNQSESKIEQSETESDTESVESGDSGQDMNQDVGGVNKPINPHINDKSNESDNSDDSDEEGVNKVENIQDNKDIQDNNDIQDDKSNDSESESNIDSASGSDTDEDVSPIPNNDIKHNEKVSVISDNMNENIMDKNEEYNKEYNKEYNREHLSESEHTDSETDTDSTISNDDFNHSFIIEENIPRQVSGRVIRPIGSMTSLVRRVSFPLCFIYTNSIEDNGMNEESEKQHMLKLKDNIVNAINQVFDIENTNTIEIFIYNKLMEYWGQII